MGHSFDCVIVDAGENLRLDCFAAYLTCARPPGRIVVVSGDTFRDLALWGEVRRALLDAQHWVAWCRKRGRQHTSPGCHNAKGPHEYLHDSDETLSTVADDFDEFLRGRFGAPTTSATRRTSSSAGPDRHLRAPTRAGNATFSPQSGNTSTPPRASTAPSAASSG